PAGWHIYSIKPAGEFGPEPTSLTILSGHAIVTPLEESPPIRFYDEAFAQELSVHQYGLELRLRIRIAPNHPSGYDELRAQLAYQVCDNRICAPLQTEFLAASLTIE
ncbi:MAG: protein-disulfide reductase DsbD domain-containing protein, partial [SAR324 cluster bacterium]|nr:protein-disulfide reductase DsbD domain-containing protein [SAR324 cluster bacterium]